ncbi:MAG: hypothetical protein OER88_07915, partial [Planctomycetota bacterium]|nr:hypothetical protein [Planctomycetota bacterium]
MTKQLLVLLLLSVLAPFAHAGDGAVITVKDANFEIRNPNPDDWDRGAIDQKQVKRGAKVYFVSAWADTDPPASVHVWVYARARGEAETDVAKIGADKQAKYENFLKNKKDRHRKTAKIGGVDCWDVDVAGTLGGAPFRYQWMVFLNGPLLYEIHVHRHAAAADDEDVDAELQQFRASFRFLGVIETKPKPDGEPPKEQAEPEPIDPKLLARTEFDSLFWKVKGVKPEGFVEVPAESYDASEK